MEKNAKIFVAGHRGMVGKALLEELSLQGYKNIILRTSKELDLRRQEEVEVFFNSEQPEYVFLAAAKVGGIAANNLFRGEFIYDNLMIQSNVVHAAKESNVKKLLFLGSSCIYPKMAPQPLKEEYLLSGPLEVTNEPYAIAKIAGIKMCEAYRMQYNCNFISAMPTNLYGPHDNYHLRNSHVLPALIRKFHEAHANRSSKVVIWGDGSPRREFMHVSDLAKASLFLMQNYESSEIINIGTGVDISIKDLALLIQKEIGYSGELVFDTSQPNGTPRKLLDVTRLNNLGFTSSITLEEGVRATIEDFKNSYAEYTLSK